MVVCPCFVDLKPYIDWGGGGWWLGEGADSDRDDFEPEERFLVFKQAP